MPARATTCRLKEVLWQRFWSFSIQCSVFRIQFKNFAVQNYCFLRTCAIPIYEDFRGRVVLSCFVVSVFLQSQSHSSLTASLQLSIFLNFIELMIFIQNVQISNTKCSNLWYKILKFERKDTKNNLNIQRLFRAKMREKCTEKGRVLKPRKPNEEQEGEKQESDDLPLEGSPMTAIRITVQRYCFFSIYANIF